MSHRLDCFENLCYETTVGMNLTHFNTMGVQVLELDIMIVCETPMRMQSPGEETG
jgi:hypothetical protein